jgi:flagellar biosynthetic protein FliO
MEGVFLRMVLSLGAVLGLMIGLMYLVKRFVLPGSGSMRTAVQIEVLGRRTLQPKKSVVVVRVAGKVLVLGVSEHGMQTLTELTEEEVEATSPGPVRSAAVEHKPFITHLHDTLITMRRRHNSEVGV